MSWWKIGIGVIVLGALGWFGWTMTRPVPGVKVADLGREHVAPEQVASTTYNSNPPSSGPHLETWVKAGIYDAPQSEGELIHSLEHGYVIISYNCGVHLQSSVIPGLTRNPEFFLTGSRLGGRDDIIKKVYAHEDASPSGDFNKPELATGSAITDSATCATLRQQLSDLANRKRLWKLIVVPRPQLDTTIALTAWTYIDKFDQFDARRIERFIDYHRDQGPEKTME